MEHLKLFDDMLCAQVLISKPCFYIWERLKIAPNKTLANVSFGDEKSIFDASVVSQTKLKEQTFSYKYL